VVRWRMYTTGCLWFAGKEGATMNVKELVLKNRSYRRFEQGVRIEEKTLRELVELARCSGTAANRQPLKFMLSADAEKNARIFKTVGFARQLSWQGPEEGDRPSAYIIILGDLDLSKSFGCDHGIAAQSILLGAVEKGLGGVMLGSANKDVLRAELKIPEKYDILLVIALGKPKETVVLEKMPADGKTAYWRDEKGVHHVPKRSLDELIVG
jgi:nitroreductase